MVLRVSLRAGFFAMVFFATLFFGAAFFATRFFATIFFGAAFFATRFFATIFFGAAFFAAGLRVTLRTAVRDRAVEVLALARRVEAVFNRGFRAALGFFRFVDLTAIVKFLSVV
jgi:hypothetical protein